MQKEIEQQRRKIEVEIIKENHLNSINRDILYICGRDLEKKTPFRQFKFESYGRKLKALN